MEDGQERGKRTYVSSLRGLLSKPLWEKGRVSTNGVGWISVMGEQGFRAQGRRTGGMSHGGTEGDILNLCVGHGEWEYLRAQVARC